MRWQNLFNALLRTTEYIIWHFNELEPFLNKSQAYTKSLCATALTGAHLQGALPLDKVPAMRALVIGLGAGSIPLWLEHTFSKDKMEPWSFQQEDREFF